MQARKRVREDDAVEGATASGNEAATHAVAKKRVRVATSQSREEILERFADILKRNPWMQEQGFIAPLDNESALRHLLPILDKFDKQAATLEGQKVYPALRAQPLPITGQPMPLGASYFGGTPQLPSSWEWPKHSYACEKAGDREAADTNEGTDLRPMYFLGQINIGDLRDTFMYHCHLFPPAFYQTEEGRCRMLYFFIVDDPTYSHVCWSHSTPENGGCTNQYVFGWTGAVRELQPRSYPDVRAPTNLASSVPTTPPAYLAVVKELEPLLIHTLFNSCPPVLLNELHGATCLPGLTRAMRKQAVRWMMTPMRWWKRNCAAKRKPTRAMTRKRGRKRPRRKKRKQANRKRARACWGICSCLVILGSVKKTPEVRAMMVKPPLSSLANHQEDEEEEEEEGDKEKEKGGKVKRDEILVLWQATGFGWNGQSFFTISKANMQKGNWSSACFLTQDA